MDRNLSDYATRLNTLEEDADLIFKKNAALEDRVMELEEIVSAQTVMMDELRRNSLNGSNHTNVRYVSPTRHSTSPPPRRRRSRSRTPPPHRPTEKEACTAHFDNRGRVELTDEFLRSVTAKYGKIIEVYVAPPKHGGQVSTWGTVRFETRDECQKCKDDWKEIQSTHKIGVNDYKSHKRYRRT